MEKRQAILLSMRDSMYRGGPDDLGVYLDGKAALGHRRLSIIDLSERGHQPMRRHDRVLVFNGEIYNYLELRQQLQRLGYSFDSDSDTEVILHALDAWGDQAVERFSGIFAFAVWEPKLQRLTLCRDRLGIKPLFWYLKDGLFAFSSELKAFHQHPNFDKTLDLHAYALYLLKGFIPSPQSIYHYVRKLPPGHLLKYSCNTQQIEVHRYWDPTAVLLHPAELPEEEERLCDQLETLLRQRFSLRLVADVPVGVFLSGGIDSTVLATLLQQAQIAPIPTFTIGFEDLVYDEAAHAKAIARHLGCQHTELICSQRDLLEVIPQLPEMYDEPMGDTSGIPSYLLAKMAHPHIKVGLSADGGDELFGGYLKHQYSYQNYPKLARIPLAARRMLHRFAAQISPRTLQNLSLDIPFIRYRKHLASQFSKARQAISAKDLQEFFFLISSYVHPKELERLLPYPAEIFRLPFSAPPHHFLSYVGLIDICTYLEGDILCKLDRATMFTGMEGRTPFLDHQIVEYALQIPDRFKFKDGTTKYLLRKILRRHLPQHLFDRPKQGFAIPLEEIMQTFLQQDLRQMAGDQKFHNTFALNSAEINRLTTRFITKKGYVNTYFIWFLLNSYYWWQRWK